jgi:hypothetical protein
VDDIITREEAKELLHKIRSGDLHQFESKEALLKCFSTIRKMLPILRERAAMDCVCLNMDFCGCGKSDAQRILNAVKSWPKRKTSRTVSTWYGNS